MTSVQARPGRRPPAYPKQRVNYSTRHPLPGTRYSVSSTRYPVPTASLHRPWRLLCNIDMPPSKQRTQQQQRQQEEEQERLQQEEVLGCTFYLVRCAVYVIILAGDAGAAPVGATLCAAPAAAATASFQRRSRRGVGAWHKWKTFSVSTQRYPIFFFYLLPGQNTCMFFFSQHQLHHRHTPVSTHTHTPTHTCSTPCQPYCGSLCLLLKQRKLVFSLWSRFCRAAFVLPVAFNVK